MRYKSISDLKRTGLTSADVTKYGIRAAMGNVAVEVSTSPLSLLPLSSPIPLPLPLSSPELGPSLVLSFVLSSSLSLSFFDSFYSWKYYEPTFHRREIFYSLADVIVCTFFSIFSINEFTPSFFRMHKNRKQLRRWWLRSENMYATKTRRRKRKRNKRGGKKRG